MGRPKGSKNKVQRVREPVPEPLKGHQHQRGDKATLETIGINRLGVCPVCGTNDWAQSELFKSVKICRGCCSELTVVLRRKNIDMLQEHYKSLNDCPVVLVPYPFTAPQGVTQQENY